MNLLYSDSTERGDEIIRFDEHDNLELYDPHDSTMWKCDTKLFLYKKCGTVLPPVHHDIVSDGVGNDYTCRDSKILRNGTEIGVQNGHWTEIAVNAAGTLLAIRGNNILHVYKIK